VAGCKVHTDVSAQFKKLREHYRKSYRKIDQDLEDLFKSVSENLEAKNYRAKPDIAGIPGGLRLVKYRQNSKDIRRGASYGWRVYALFAVETRDLYPILVFPKTECGDLDSDTIIAAIKELIEILKRPADE
jgi:hypothetical protein